MKIEYPAPKYPDMSPEAIEQRLEMVEALRKLGLSLKEAGEQARRMDGVKRPTSGISGRARES